MPVLKEITDLSSKAEMGRRFVDKTAEGADCLLKCKEAVRVEVLNGQEATVVSSNTNALFRERRPSQVEEPQKDKVVNDVITDSTRHTM